MSWNSRGGGEEPRGNSDEKQTLSRTSGNLNTGSYLICTLHLKSIFFPPNIDRAHFFRHYVIQSRKSSHITSKFIHFFFFKTPSIAALYSKSGKLGADIADWVKKNANVSKIFLQAYTFSLYGSWYMRVISPGFRMLEKWNGDEN